MKYQTNENSTLSALVPVLTCVLALGVGAERARAQQTSGDDQEQTQQTEEAEAQGENEQTDQQQNDQESKTAEAPPKKKNLTDEQRAQYEKHIKKGSTAYKNKNYEQAFIDLKAAYDIHPKPSILFNLGLSSEKTGNLERAKKYYQKFTEAPGVSLKDRQRASKRLSAIKEILKSSESSEEAEKKAEENTTDLQPALKAMESGLDTGETSSGTKDGQSDGEETSAEEGQQSQAQSQQNVSGGASGTAGPPQGQAAGESTSSRPEVQYTWPVYASYGTAVALLSAGAGTLLVSNMRLDTAKAAAKNGETQKKKKYQRKASTWMTTSVGLFAGGGVLVGLGTYFVIRQSAQAAKGRTALDDSGVSKPTIGVSVNPEFTGATLKVDF